MSNRNEVKAIAKTATAKTNGNGTSTGSANGKEVKPESKPEVKNNELEAMKKQFAEMQKQFEAIQNENKELKKQKTLSLAERLEQTQRLNSLIASRDKFLSVKDKLEFMTIEKSESLDFEETHEYQLNLYDKHLRNEVFSISNTYIIEALKNCMLTKVSEKVLEIEKEIENLNI